MSLIVAHVVFLILAYAEVARKGVWHEAGTLVRSFPDVLVATVGFVLMLTAAVVSIRAIRRRIGRDRWWAIHLFMYLALALSFAHVIALGPSFVGHPLARIVWGAFGWRRRALVTSYRFGLPIVRSFRHRLEVVEVRAEGPGVVSIICTGRKLDRLAVSAGQFFEWRFLVPGMRWRRIRLPVCPPEPALPATDGQGFGRLLLGCQPAAARDTSRH